jgi:hypothetical protein
VGFHSIRLSYCFPSQVGCQAPLQRPPCANHKSNSDQDDAFPSITQCGLWFRRFQVSVALGPRHEYMVIVEKTGSGASTPTANCIAVILSLDYPGDNIQEKRQDVNGGRPVNVTSIEPVTARTCAQGRITIWFVVYQDMEHPARGDPSTAVLEHSLATGTTASRA